MTNTEIETLFNQVIEEKAIYNELTGISEDKIYNWRKGRGAKPTIGDMLNVLYQLKRIRLFVADAAKAQKIKYENMSDDEAKVNFEETISRLKK